MKAAKCPRCGADMINGVCDNCGFPIVGSGRTRTKAIRAGKGCAQIRRFDNSWGILYR